MTCNYCPRGADSCNYCNSRSNSWVLPEEAAEYAFQQALNEIKSELEELNSLNRKRTDYERGQRDALEFVIEILENI